MILTFIKINISCDEIQIWSPTNLKEYFENAKIKRSYFVHDLFVCESWSFSMISLSIYMLVPFSVWWDSNVKEYKRWFKWQCSHGLHLTKSVTTYGTLFPSLSTYFVSQSNATPILKGWTTLVINMRQSLSDIWYIYSQSYNISCVKVLYNLKLVLYIQNRVTIEDGVLISRSSWTLHIFLGAEHHFLTNHLAVFFNSMNTEIITIKIITMNPLHMNDVEYLSLKDSINILNWHQMRSKLLKFHSQMETPYN